MRRMWVRNLGRDDRLVSDWGREARHPFLDEGVMQLLLQCSVSDLADLNLAPGEGGGGVVGCGGDSSPGGRVRG